MMPTLIITVGLPGSGKSTWARQWVAENPHWRARVNRDDLRDMLHGGRKGTAWQERQVTLAQHAAVRALLERGYEVVVDDTNLVASHRRELLAIARECGAKVVIRRFDDIPVETCIARDARRPRRTRVGAEVIRRMAATAEW